MKSNNIFKELLDFKKTMLARSEKQDKLNETQVTTNRELFDVLNRLSQEVLDLKVVIQQMTSGTTILQQINSANTNQMSLQSEMETNNENYMLHRLNDC